MKQNFGKGADHMAIQLNLYHAVAVAAVLYGLGGWLIRKIRFFEAYCIPAPLVGGLCFALLNAGLYAAGLPYIAFDATLQTVFMNMFFTTVGFTVSLPLLVKGGKAVLLCLLLASLLTLAQNLLGAGAMLVMGQDPSISRLLVLIGLAL